MVIAARMLIAMCCRAIDAEGATERMACCMHCNWFLTQKWVLIGRSLIWLAQRYLALKAERVEPK